MVRSAEREAAWRRRPSRVGAAASALRSIATPVCPVPRCTAALPCVQMLRHPAGCKEGQCARWEPGVGMGRGNSG